MRDLIRLVSTAGTGTFYTTTRNKKPAPAPGKNKKLGTEKLQLIKFDRRAKNEKTGRLGAHVLFKEEKIK